MSNNGNNNSEQLRREAISDFEKASADLDNAQNDFNNSFADSLRDKGGTERVERKPADAIGSQGYNSNNANKQGSTQGRASGLPNREALDKNKQSSDNVSSDEGGSQVTNGYQPNQGHDPKETAPDIGKDYGDLHVPNQNNSGAGNNQGSSEHHNDLDEQTGKNDGLEQKDGLDGSGENQVDKKVPEAAQNQNAQGGDAQTGDKKPNELDNIDKQKQQEAQQKKQQNNGGSGDNQTGNGYGALKRNNKNRPQAPDTTQNARRNLDHQNKVNSENSGTKNNNLFPKRTAQGGLGGGLMSGLRNRFKGGMKNFFNRSENKFSDGNNGSDAERDNSFMGDLLNNLMSSLTSNPYFLITCGVVLLFIIILIATMDGGIGGKGKKVCSYELSGLSSSGTIEIKNAKVELINCDGSEDGGYEVLDTIDFEKYVLGVTLAEAGPGHSSPETYKAQLIAVRNFTLTRHLGMCPSNPDDCFFGYNVQTNTFRMRACTNDQVYWDYTKDIYTELRDGKPSLYGPEAEANGYVWKTALSPEDQKKYEAIAAEVMGEVLLDENGDVLKVGYQADETQTFISMGEEGAKYTEILKEVYGSDNMSHGKCTYTGHFDYGDYTLTSDNHSVLNQPLDQFLESNGSSLEEFNELIEKNVDNAGFGTRAGVVAAAVTLIGELGDNYGVKVPYYWGGGHADGVVVGALAKWGSTNCRTEANGRVYDRCGLDCSGFVPWAIKNGGFGMAQNLASNFQYISGARRVSLNSNSAVVQPGDLLESEEHVVLVVAIDEENKQYICAEAAGYDYGVLFVRRAFGSSGYWGVDMEDYYNNESNVRSKE